MTEYIEREAALYGLEDIDWYHVNGKGQLVPGGTSEMETYIPFKAVENMLRAIPAADVVPWETLMRYANYFCALVSMPEFVREAKMFYDSTKAAMDGGNIE